jgi:hypothetical protein
MLRVFHSCRNDRANVTRSPTIFIGTGLSVRSMGTEFQSRYHEDLRNEADITKQVRQLEMKYRTIKYQVSWSNSRQRPHRLLASCSQGRMPHSDNVTSQALARRLKNHSLTRVQQRLVKTGGRLVKNAHYYSLLLAEGHLPQHRFGRMLGKIAALPLPNGSRTGRNSESSAQKSSSGRGVGGEQVRRENRLKLFSAETSNELRCDPRAAMSI